MPNKHLDKDDPMRGKKSGKWTKYGGSVSGLVKSKIDTEWTCQICGETIPAELKPFIFELFPGDYIRICNGCQSEVNKNRTHDTYVTFIHVKRIVRG